MKLTIHANEFCLDDCPYCEVDTKILYDVSGKIHTDRYCVHIGECRYAVESKQAQSKQEA